MNNTIYRKADLHVHSCRSHDVPDFACFEPRALFEKAMGRQRAERRMDYFTLTDHETMAGFEDLCRSLPEGDRRLVIPGVEHTLRDPNIGFSVHINLYYLHPDQYAEIRGDIRTLPELLGYCRPRGIFMQYNHPTWWEREELKAGVVSLAKVKEIADHFDVLELNAGRTVLLNSITENLAREKGKFLTCNSDTHTGEVGKACTTAPGETPEEFIRNVWSGLAKPIQHNMTHAALLSMVHSVIDLLFDHRRGVWIKPTAMDSGNRCVEAVTQRLLGSDRVMGNALVREPLRLLLKQVARPAVRAVMAHEHRLERTLMASPHLRYYI